MAETDSVFWQKKAEPKQLVLSFDEGENVLECIEIAMKERKIFDARVKGCIGCIKSGAGTFLLGNSIKTKSFANTGVKTASSHFKCCSQGLFGVLKAVAPESPETHITVAKATASEGLEITLYYNEFCE